MIELVKMEVDVMKRKITTKELFDDYFKDMPLEKSKKIRPQIDREEVYAHEIKLNKRLIEMNSDELFDMLLTFKNNKSSKNKSYRMAYSTYNHIASLYRAVFEFYCYKYEVIRNPFHEKAMKGAEASKRLSRDIEAFSYEKFEEIIKMIREEYDESRANYYECILLLFYNGFKKAEEIVNLKEENIDFKNKFVILPGRTIKLSDRCFELLIYVHNLEYIDCIRGDYPVVSWRGSYFKHIIRKKEVDAFDERPQEEIANIINRRIIENVNKRLGVAINYRLLYMLGFYDYLVREKGAEKVREFVLTPRNDEDIKEFFLLSKKYNVLYDNITYIKQNLKPFI